MIPHKYGRQGDLWSMHNYTFMRYVPLSHLRSKGKASAYILYCTGSGMLTRYTHCGQCNIFYIAPTTVRISR